MSIGESPEWVPWDSGGEWRSFGKLADMELRMASSGSSASTARFRRPESRRGLVGHHHCTPPHDLQASLQAGQDFPGQRGGEPFSDLLLAAQHSRRVLMIPASMKRKGHDARNGRASRALSRFSRSRSASKSWQREATRVTYDFSTFSSGRVGRSTELLPRRESALPRHLSEPRGAPREAAGWLPRGARR